MSVEVALDELGELYCPTCERSFEAGETCPTDGERLVRIVRPPDTMIGRVLDGRYTILEKIGFGGMGAVYRARQHSVEREVAVKVIHSNLAGEPEVVKRFLREAKLASKLAHPGAVAVLDFGQTEDGVFFLVMELIAGRTLDVVFQELGTFDARRLVRVAVQICDVLEAAHGLSIIHRDLKPSNIIVLSSGRDLVKVLDFGLAKSLEHDAHTTNVDGGVCGTPAFMAPERALGQPCDGRSDLYSLGCILYLLGSGKLPFSQGTPHQLMQSQVFDAPPLMTGVPLALAEVIDRLLAKDPAQRYQSAAELRDALDLAVPDRHLTTGGMMPLPRPATGSYLTAASEPAVLPEPRPVAPPPRPRPPAPVLPGASRPSRRSWPLVAICGLAVVSIVTAWTWGGTAMSRAAPRTPARVLAPAVVAEPSVPEVTAPVPAARPTPTLAPAVLATPVREAPIAAPTAKPVRPTKLKSRSAGGAVRGGKAPPQQAPSRLPF